MTPAIKFTPDQYNKIISFFSGSNEERVVFGLIKNAQNNRDIFMMNDLVCIPDNGMLNPRYSVELTEDMQASLIKQAWDSECSLVEMHSHPFCKNRVQFSSFDIEQFRIFVPYVYWRLKGRPYIALVFGQEDFDALAWIKDSQKNIKLRGLLVDNRLLKPTNLTYNSKHKWRWLWWMK